jgi:tetratricopeptide (TPR) repeat protein
MQASKFLTILTFSVTLLVPNGIVMGQKAKKSGKETDAARLREAEYQFVEGEKYFILEDYAKAMSLFQKSLELNPANATVHYKMAEIYSKAGEPAKALSHIALSLELEKNNKYFYLAAADIYTQLSDFDNATKVLEKMMSQINGTDEYLFELAALYLYQNKFEKAIACYDRAEALFGINEQSSLQKQKIYIHINKLPEAIREGERLLELNPDEEEYLMALMEVLLANDKLHLASEHLSRFLENNPSSAQAKLLAAEVYRQLGDKTKAEKYLLEAFEDSDLEVENKIGIVAAYRAELPNPSIQALALQLGEMLAGQYPEVAHARAVYADVLQALNKKPEAAREYSASLNLDDSNFVVWHNLIQLYAELEAMDSVIYFAERALELFPNQAILYYFNGVAYFQNKQYKTAIQNLEQGKKFASSDLAFLSAFNSMLGEAYNGTKEYAKSDKAFQAALDFDSDNYLVLNNYSYYLALRKDNLENAERMAAKVAKAHPANATYLDTYAWVLYMRGKYKEARKVMEQALRAGEDVGAVHYDHYGDILYKLGEVEAAVSQWKKAKELDAAIKNIDRKIAEKKLYE